MNKLNRLKVRCSVEVLEAHEHDVMRTFVVEAGRKNIILLLFAV